MPEPDIERRVVGQNVACAQPQRARRDVGGAGVGVRTAQNQRTIAGLRHIAVAGPAVLNDAGDGRGAAALSFTSSLTFLQATTWAV